MFAKSLSVLLLLFGSFTWASGLEQRSARREPGVSYEAYKAHAKMQSESQTTAVRTPVQEAKPFATAVLPPATSWESEAAMLDRFKQVRDHRFINDSARPSFIRRSTWLYPDDGCFARAGLAIKNLSQWAHAIPSKVFVFGNLTVKTQNSTYGEVSWWYHVAPLVQVNGEKYVLDPAIDPRAPLKLADWLGHMSSDPGALEVAVCGSGSYTPYDSCVKNTDGVESMALSDQNYFLGSEWHRLEQLRRNPEQELGDLPPWLEDVTL